MIGRKKVIELVDICIQNLWECFMDDVYGKKIGRKS